MAESNQTHRTEFAYYQLGKLKPVHAGRIVHVADMKSRCLVEFGDCCCTYQVSHHTQIMIQTFHTLSFYGKVKSETFFSASGMAIQRQLVGEPGSEWMDFQKCCTSTESLN